MADAATGIQARPIVKWAGGKTKLLPELLARMPDKFGRYYEPFAGGAALFLRVAPKRAVLGDANADLIACYRTIGTDCDAVLDLLRWHAVRHARDHYLDIRRAWNTDSIKGWHPPARAAALIYLLKTNFNGLWRVNRAGKFNVGWGKHKRYTPDVDGLRAASAALARATLRTGDYRATVADARRGDFVYFDPPYDRTFTGYTARSFGPEQQRELAETLRKLVARGCSVMLSNSDTKLIRSLYKGLRIYRVKCPRAINSNGAGRGEVNEVIITGGYEPPRRKR